MKYLNLAAVKRVAKLIISAVLDYKSYGIISMLLLIMIFAI